MHDQSIHTKIYKKYTHLNLYSTCFFPIFILFEIHFYDMHGISEIQYLNYTIALINKKKYLQTILTKFSNPHCDGIFIFYLLFFNIIDTYITIKLLNVTRIKQNTESPKAKIKQSNFGSCIIIKTKVLMFYIFSIAMLNILIKCLRNFFLINFIVNDFILRKILINGLLQTAIKAKFVVYFPNHIVFLQNILSLNIIFYHGS